MSLLKFLGGYADNPYQQMNAIGDRQYGLAQDYRNKAVGFFDGTEAKKQYYRNQRAGSSLLGLSLNNMNRNLSSQGINSTALQKQNTIEMYGKAADQLYDANLDSQMGIWNVGMQMEGLGSQYEGMGNQSKAQYGQGEMWKGEQQNSFLNSTLGLAGGLAAGGAFNGLLGKAWDTVGGWLGDAVSPSVPKNSNLGQGMSLSNAFKPSGNNRLGTYNNSNSTGMWNWGVGNRINPMQRNNQRLGNFGNSTNYGSPFRLPNF